MTKTNNYSIMKVNYGRGLLDYESPLFKTLLVTCTKVLCSSGSTQLSGLSGEDYGPETTDSEFHF